MARISLTSLINFLFSIRDAILKNILWGFVNLKVKKTSVLTTLTNFLDAIFKNIFLGILNLKVFKTFNVGATAASACAGLMVKKRKDAGTR